MRVLLVTANNLKFDRRFWKVFVVTLIQILLLLAAALTLMHFFLGPGPGKQFLFGFAPVACMGLGIIIARNKLRQP